MKKVIFVIVTLLISLPLFAQEYGSDYDWQSGNSYNWNTNSLGNTRIRGNNYNTGSSWRTTIDKKSNMRGTDSEGNMWRYNNSSGSYMNYGTGETCYGKGANRRCY